MLKKHLSWLCVILLTVHSVTLSGAAAQGKATASDKLKAQLAKFGTGPKVKLEILLRDQSKRSGYLSQVKDDSFVLADSKTNATTEIAFSEAATGALPPAIEACPFRG
jgi:hypothetical protein